VSKVKGGKEGKKPHIPPKTLNHWLNAGTRDHTVGKGSSLEGNKVIQQLIANKYQIAINKVRLQSRICQNAETAGAVSGHDGKKYKKACCG
jgi:hypothetical protein